jgi:hypothetical protein
MYLLHVAMAPHQLKTRRSIRKGVAYMPYTLDDYESMMLYFCISTKYFAMFADEYS